MTDALFSDTTEQAALPPTPALPEPSFHYDSEEFWFHDGHLLLRGNNGTGKSKVLSLTLPFLFDASLKSSRIEPDGDPGKKMAWNLLLGKHERRTGYAWIEFGRIGEDGAVDYLTLGCGLAAVAARAQVDPWFFVTEQQRMGRDLWLINPQRAVLGKDRLALALGEHGRVFENAGAYRRAVDERLFHLGETRYGALMDTLIQLRQPQLSKKPNEDSLSNALTEALPPLPDDLLGDAADAMNQLEEYSTQLGELSALSKAIAQFNGVYQQYARVKARRQARQLRSAQTGFDKASRELNEARTGLQEALAGEAEQQRRQLAIDTQLRKDRAAHEEMMLNPLMNDAKRLEQLEHQAHTGRVDVEQARAAVGVATTRLDAGALQLDQIEARAVQVRTALARAYASAEMHAAGAGLDTREGWRAAAPFADADALADLPEPDHGRRQQRLHALTEQRRADIALVAERLRGESAAMQQRTHTQRARDARADELADLAAGSAAADAEVAASGAALVDAWRVHAQGLRELMLPDTGAWLDALDVWSATLEGDNPAQRALEDAQHAASIGLSQLVAQAQLEQQALLAQRAALEAERAGLALGHDAHPPTPWQRAPEARVPPRAGAALWQLIEFRTDRAWHDGEQAGLEAALEAAGILDAWVAPDGAIDLAGAGMSDTFLQARTPQARSLADWLMPAADAVVDGAQVLRLLRSIACGAAPEPDAEAWVAPDGRFRLGVLAGDWRKASAQYIGAASRAQARRVRMAQIDTALAALQDASDAVEARLARLDQRRADMTREWRAAPADSALRSAHVTAATLERQRRQAVARLAQADQALERDDALWRAARAQLHQDADDLGLPGDAQGLDQVRALLAHFERDLQALLLSAGEVRMVLPQRVRQLAHVADLERDLALAQEQATRRGATLSDLDARLDSLRALAGAKIDELQRKLANMREAVARGVQQQQLAAKDSSAAGERRARSEQRVESAAAQLAERTDARQAAVHELERFGATGLLAVAAPEFDSATPSWTIEGALGIARRAEQVLHQVNDDDAEWTRVQGALSRDYTTLSTALTALDHHAQLETTDFGMVVTIIYQNRPQRPDLIEASLRDEIAQRQSLLTARETEVLENHLQAEVAAAIQRMLREAENRRIAINAELAKRPTSTGVKFRLDWQPLPEGVDGAPVGLEAARKRLLNTSFDAWSVQDRQVVGAMLQGRITAERTRANGESASLLEMLGRALDYRRWHRFRVQRWQDGQWRPLSGPASSGERALGLTVPLFAAVSSFYTHGGSKDAPRLVLLDEAFAGIDDAARAHCMALVREFDLDFVMTSEREWACYAELPGVSICQLQRREGIDAVHVSRWRWDGRARRLEGDGVRRFPPTAESAEA
jgi:uncharacterized protein (TIGR02680 family)